MAGNQFIQQRVTNAATRQLLGNRYGELADSQEKLAAEAFEVLKSLDWFGVSELFGESLRRLATVLHVSRPPEIPRLNRTYEAAPVYGKGEATQDETST